MSFDRELHGEQSEIGGKIEGTDGGRDLWGNVALMRYGDISAVRRGINRILKIPRLDMCRLIENCMENNLR